jgi:hypothetical protein
MFVFISVFNGYQTGYAPLTPTSPGGAGHRGQFANSAQGTLEALYAAAAAGGVAQSAADFNPYGQLNNPQTGLPHSYHHTKVRCIWRISYTNLLFCSSFRVHNW